MRNAAKQTTSFGFYLPVKLHARLMRQAAKETLDCGQTVTPSRVARQALIDYLDQRETAANATSPTQTKKG